MSTLIKDFNGTDLIRVSDEYYNSVFIIGCINAVLLFFGILFETLVIASILRVRYKSVDTLFVLSLCCADMVFNLYMLPSVLMVLNAGGWSTGKLGCLISTSVITSALALSIISVTFITLNRYLAIILKTNITHTQALLMIVVSWIFIWVTVYLYGLNNELSDSSNALQPSSGYCFIDFSATDPLVVTVLIAMIVINFVPFVFMSLAYTQIILFYRKMNRSREYVTSQVYASERKLLIKAMAITSAFLVSYFFSLVTHLYLFVTKSDVSPVLDVIGTLGICSNALLNSIILLKFDGFIQSSAIELLGLQDWWKKQLIARKSKKNPNVVMLKDVVNEQYQEPQDKELAPSSLATQIIPNLKG